jgi:hypothetical protein
MKETRLTKLGSDCQQRDKREGRERCRRTSPLLLNKTSTVPLFQSSSKETLAAITSRSLQSCFCIASRKHSGDRHLSPPSCRTFKDGDLVWLAIEELSKGIVRLAEVIFSLLLRFIPARKHDGDCHFESTQLLHFRGRHGRQVCSEGEEQGQSEVAEIILPLLLSFTPALAICHGLLRC